MASREEEKRQRREEREAAEAAAAKAETRKRSVLVGFGLAGIFMYLILLLANQIGDISVLRQALQLARKGL